MSLTDEDKQWLSENLATKEWVAEQLELVETKLLTAFQKWASPQEARQRTHSAALRAIDVEMESLDDRMKALEKRPGPT